MSDPLHCGPMAVRHRAQIATRSWNAATAVVIAVAIVAQLVLVVRGSNVLVADEAPPSTGTRVVRFFSYFTVQSNLFVLGTSLALFVRPDRDGRVFRVLRLDALIGITVTGIIYVTLLRPIVDLHGAAALTDVAFHYAAPLLAVVGWLLFGPRPRVDETTQLASLLWPALYVGYTIAHGAATDWWPYPFVDADALGYAVVLRNGVGICLLMLGVAATFRVADRRLPSRPHPRR
jgi:hypothetical protein